MANSKSTLILRPSHRPSGRVGEIARKDLEVDGDQCVAESLPSAASAELLPRGTFDEAQSNGDEVDARMAEIEVILDHAAMHLLDKCALVAEWVRHAEARVWVFGQVDQKPGGGRPEGGIARAARALPVPGKTTEARRKFVERAVKIYGIWPEVKVAVRTAGLDDTQSALLAIASERSSEAQLAKVQEIVARKAMPRRKSSVRDSDELATSSAAQSGTTSYTNPRIEDAVDIPELAAVCNETSTIEQKAQLATFKALASDEQSEPPSNSEIDQSKPASSTVLINFAKFILAHINQGEKIVLTLTATEDVKEFNCLANRVRLVLRQHG